MSLASMLVSDHVAKSIDLQFEIWPEIWIKNPNKAKRKLEKTFEEYQNNYDNPHVSWWDAEDGPGRLVVPWVNPLFTYDEVRRTTVTLSAFFLKSAIIKAEQMIRLVPDGLLPQEGLTSSDIADVIADYIPEIPYSMDDICRAYLELDRRNKAIQQNNSNAESRDA